MGSFAWHGKDKTSNFEIMKNIFVAFFAVSCLIGLVFGAPQGLLQDLLDSVSPDLITVNDSLTAYECPPVIKEECEWKQVNGRWKQVCTKKEVKGPIKSNRNDCPKN